MHQGLQDLQGEEGIEGPQVWEASEKACPGNDSMAYSLYRPDRSLQDWERQEAENSSLSHHDRSRHRLVRDCIDLSEESRLRGNYLEMTWLTRYPWPTEIVLDRGSEFKLEVQDALKDECGINKKLITTRNPQANSMVERVHQTVHNMLKVSQMDDGDDCD